VDGQMDGCAQGCMKEGALKIEFLSHLPVRRRKVRTIGKKEASL